MHYKVVITKRAAMMLSEHIRFIAQASEVAAINTRLAIVDAVKDLADMPMRYSRFAVTNREIHYYKCLVGKRYWLIYYVKDNAVFVDYILDCRQDNNKYFI